MRINGGVDGRKRIVIQHVKPQIDEGKFPAKRVVGESVDVTAEIFIDGHEHINANVLWKKEGDPNWNITPMSIAENDLWKGTFSTEVIGTYIFTVEAWVDHFETWQENLKKKVKEGVDVSVEFKIGVEYLTEVFPYLNENELKGLQEWKSRLLSKKPVEEKIAAMENSQLSQIMRGYTRQRNPCLYPKELKIISCKKKALFSSWYEMFPRSSGTQHGTFKELVHKLPEIVEMGFDVLYLPPIHPIGRTNRKGKNNAIQCLSKDPGSPWAIGSSEGGHDAVNPELGTLDDFRQFVAEAERLGIDIALDLAFQCSPDHPYVKKHPKWFKWRPDGTIQYAENPPKKYEDIIPFNFETDLWESLWIELKRVVLFWVKQGIKIFRVDNPHTKPFVFWKWLIAEVKAKDPEIIFLSEAFTRPKVMQYLAKVGFDQSYTYFTWRNTKCELIEYVTELTKTEMREYFRPNYWPNTPDILPEALQHGGRPAFIARLILASTLSSSYGIYGPPYELCINQAIEGKEEYLNSEKYEVHQWDRRQKGNLVDFISLINRIRKENTAFHNPWNLQFCDVDNNQLLAYLKLPSDDKNPFLIVVNLDYFNTQSGWVSIPLNLIGIKEDQSFLVHDLLTDEKYMWKGSVSFVKLNPSIVPAHIFQIHKLVRKEQDFDYYL